MPEDTRVRISIGTRRGKGRRAAIAVGAVVALLLAAAGSASAYTVTVHVHGAGNVQEVTNRTGGTRNLLNCSVGPSGTSNNSVTDCVGGTADGLYSFGDIVRLGESVSATQANRGWAFDHWTDGTASGQINCDPQDSTGDFSNPTYCEFQIFQNLYVDLWFHDSTGPQDTAISGGPAQGSVTKQTSATFTSFSAASDPDATFQCKLDPPGSVGSFGSCPTNGATFSNLTQNGTWTLTVRAVDPSGNVDTTPASRSWTVDTTPPTTSLSGGPAEGSTINQTSAAFNIGASDGTLTCTLDGAPLTCSGPSKTYSSLGDGAHTFSLTATDTAGNTSTPLTRHWTVDTAPPTVTLSGGPAQNSVTDQTTATFTIGTSEGTLSCTLDAVTVACAPPSVTLSSLSDGVHTFAISASDTAGNTGTQSRSWAVSTTSDAGGSTSSGGGGSTGTAPAPVTPAPPAKKKCKKGRKLRHGRCVKKRH